MKVFLSAAAGTDTADVRQLLHTAGVTVTTADALPAEGRWIDGLLEHLQSCDAAVIVPFGGASGTVLVEAGAALGIGLPLVVIARNDQDRAAVPFALRELPVIAMGGDVRATAERLSATLISLMSMSPVVRPGGSTSLANQQARSSPTYRSEREIQDRVAAVFAQAGARVVSELRTPDGMGRVDLAVSMPNLLAPAFDPVLVEIIDTNIGNKSAVGGVEQVRYYLGQLGLLLGMVVVSGSADPEWHISARHGAVVVIGLHRLESLTADRLAKLLSDGRNKLVHGAA